MSPFRAPLCPLLLLAALGAACGAGTAHADWPHPPARAPRLVSVTVEDGHGHRLPTYRWENAVYVAGEPGRRYVVHVENLTAERLEAVVSVDGRDVITGRLGNYRHQRGHVLPPYGSVVIDGFRRSLDHVAAFRFSSVEDSYSARRGTPEHVGVIGVAVFREKPRTRRPRPLRPSPPPRHHHRRSPSSAAPTTEDGAGPGRSGTEARRSRAREGAEAHVRGAPLRGDDAPAPTPRGRLGTAFGETRISSVAEVTFRRRHRFRPDEVARIHYDSLQGLWARGVPVHQGHEGPPLHAPDPWPSARGFAPPPPR